MGKIREILNKMQRENKHSGCWILNLYCKTHQRKLTDDEVFDRGFNYALSEIDFSALHSELKGLMGEEEIRQALISKVLDAHCSMEYICEIAKVLSQKYQKRLKGLCE